MTELIDGSRSFVAGRWRDPEATVPVGNPADETVVATAAVTQAAEVETAVAEARRCAEAADLPPGVLSVIAEEGPAGATVLSSDPRTLMGPFINAAARQRCERYVAVAEEHGGKVATGGGRPDRFDRGSWFEPTVLDLPDNSNPAARDEIFGPVLGIIGYEDVDDAVRIANDSPYGLSAQVFSADVAAAAAIGRRIRSGAVQVNASVFSAYAAGGGYKQSGLGRERGTDGIAEFQEVKHLAIGELAR